MANYYQIYWFLAFSLAFFLYSKYLFETFKFSLALALTYTIFQTFLFGEYITTQTPYSMPVNLVLKVHSLEALLTVFLSIFIVDRIKINPKIMAYVCIVNIVVTAILIPFTKHLNWPPMAGLSMNPAMNASITAITLPFLFYLADIYIVPFITFGIILILMTKNFTPILAVAIGFFGPSFLESRKKTRYLSIGIVAGLLTFFLFRHHSHIEDRLYNWKFFWHYWRENFNWLVGSGNGSFSTWGPIAQRMSTFNDDAFLKRFLPSVSNIWANYHGMAHWYWLWLHSDIYQTLWEMGVMGLMLWAWAIYDILKSVRKNEIIFAGCLSWLVVAMFYYPLHFPIQLGLGLSLFVLARNFEE